MALAYWRIPAILAAEVASAMKYPKRSQYKYAKRKEYRTRNWGEYEEHPQEAALAIGAVAKPCHVFPVPNLRADRRHL